ncbi:unnamed protein product [Closterium sp. NIES-53]
MTQPPRSHALGPLREIKHSCFAFLLTPSARVGAAAASVASMLSSLVPISSAVNAHFRTRSKSGYTIRSWCDTNLHLFDPQREALKIDDEVVVEATAAAVKTMWADSPLLGFGVGGGAVGAPVAGPGVRQKQPPSRLETPSPQQLREWVVRRGRSGAGAWNYIDAGVASAGGTIGAASDGAGGTRGTGAAGATGPRGPRGAGATGHGGHGGEGATGSRGARTRGSGVARAGGTGGTSGTSLRTTLTPLSQPVAVSLADPSRGPVLAHSSTVLPCPAAPSGLLSGLHLPSFSTNLVSGADLQDAWVDQFAPGGQRVTHCTCSWTGRHLATFTSRPGSSLYTLTTGSPLVSASGQVAASSQVFAATSRSCPASSPCSYRPLSHETLLWHHRLGYPSLPRLRGMASRTLVSGLPRSLPPLPPGPAPTCVPCVEGWQRAAPHSSTFPPTEAPLQTLHMDVWGPPRVRGQGHERYFLLVVDDYSRYTTVFPLHSKDRGGEFSSDLLRAFCRAKGIRQTFTLPASPQQNGIAECRIGMVMCVTRMSMIHVAAPHFLWPFAVQYAAHQINLQPRVSLPETTPTLRWTGRAGDVSAFRVWGSRAFVRDTSADNLPSHAVPCVFLGFPPDAPGWQFYHPTSRLVLSSQDVTFDKSVSYNRLFPYHPAEPVEVAVDSGAARGSEPAGAGTGGAESGGAEPERVEPRGVGAGGAAGVVAGDLGAEGTSGVSAVSGGAARPRPYYVPLLQQVLGRPPSPGPTPPLLTPPPVQSQSQLQPASPLPGPSPYSGPTRGLTEHREPESRPVSPESRPASPESCSALPVRTVCAGRRVSRPRPRPVPGTHSMTLRPSTTPQRVPLSSLPASSLPDGPDPESDSLRAASPIVTRFLATAVTDPLFESTAASALVAELVDFAAACRLDFATSLVAESASESVYPPSVKGECALGTDVLQDRQEEFECFAATVPHLVSMLLAPEGDPDAPDIPTPRSYAEAIEGPYSSQWQAAMDAEMASWKSTGTYVDKVPTPGANIVSGMWIFRGVDFFQTFSPTPKMTTIWVLLHVAAHRTYKLHSLDFSTAFLQGSLHEEIWLRHPPGFTGTTLADLGFAPSTADPSLFLRSDTTLPPFYVLVYVDDLVFATADTEALAHVLQRFGFTYSSPQSTPLPTCHSLSTPPSDESIEPSGSYQELVGCLIYLMTCTRPDLAYPLSLLARYVSPGRHRKVHWDAAKRVLRYLCNASWVDDLATQRSSQGYTFSLGSGSVSWRSTCSSSILSSSCEAEIYAGAMAAQELRWLTYLLIDLGEAPRSPPVLYHRGQLRLAYMASQANTADVFTKALQPCDHQPCFAFLDWSCDLLPSRPPATAAAAAAARATAAAGGGAAGSAGGAATQPHRAALLLLLVLLLLLLVLLPFLVEVRLGGCVPGRVEAAALGSSESAVAPGAGESAAALGARESTDPLGASASTTTGPASTEALHTFTLDSGASRCFFRDCTTVTPLAAPVPVSLANPTGGPVVLRASTVLPCPAVPSGSLSGLHLPLFLTNLLSNAVHYDEWPGSGLYTLTTESAQVAESGQVAASSRVAASASGTLSPDSPLAPPPRSPLAATSPQHALPSPSLWPSQVPALPPALACPAVPSLRRGATLHMDVWGPAPVGGTDQERYFLLVVDDYTCYTTVFPLRRKVDISGVLIPWICATRCQMRDRFSWVLPVLCLHSDRGGEFSSDLLADFCRDEGIRQLFMLPASPQQNGIAEHCIGLIMEVARTSMIHVAAPHFLWPFAVRYAAHQLNLWPHVWGALSLVRDTTASKLSPPTLRCVFLGFPTDAPPWQFYHPSSRRVFSSQDVTFDESVYPPLLVEPLEFSSDSSGPAEGVVPAADDTAATRRSPRLETPPGFLPRPSSPPPQPAAMDFGAETVGAELGGAETEGEGSRGAATWGATTGGADSGGVAIRAWIVRRVSQGGGGYGLVGAGGTRGAANAEGAGATSPRGPTGAGGAGPTSPGGTAGGGGAGGAAGAGGAGAGGTGGAGASGPGGARTGGAGAARAGGAVSVGGAEGTGAAGATGAGAAGAAGPGGARTRGTGAAGAGGATSAGSATGAAGTGGAGAAGTGGARAAGTGGARTRGAGATGTEGARTRGAEAAGAGGAAGNGGAGGTAGAGGAGAGGTGGTGGARAAGPGGALTRGAGAAGARGAPGAGRATGDAGTGGVGGSAGARRAGAAGARGAAGAGDATRAAGAGSAGAAGTGGAGAAGTAPC